MPADPAECPRPAGILASLLPARVAAAETMGTAARDGAGLFAAEREAVRTAGPRRRADFAAGRLCARAALARLGVPAAPILPGPAGEPRWPPGVTGSITHCAGYRAAAVAMAADAGAVGIDAEPDQPLPAGLLPAVATGREQARAAVVLAAPAPGVSWDRLLFSAKEAVCKLWFPLTGHWPGFCNVTVRLSADGTFTARVQGGGQERLAGAAGPLVGRWAARGGLIVTAVTRRP